VKRFLVVQHSYSEFLGSFERLLEDRHIGFTYSRPFLGEALPATALHHDALWVLGGPHRIGDVEALAYAQEEQRLIAAFRRGRRPVVGIGYGALAVALQCGATIDTDAAGDARFVRAEVTRDGGADPVAAAIAGEQVLMLHAGGVRLPPSIPALARAQGGEWLLARPDALTYALLFRPEMKPGTLEDMVMEEGRFVPDNIGELIEEARLRWESTQALAARVLSALVSALDLMQERHKAAVIPVRVVKG
jgi:GMP synthase (glutamine-hydrolysing)